MEEEIKQAYQSLKRYYAYYWFLALLLFAYGESGVSFYEGALADNVRAVYAFESAVIVLTAVCVPGGLKLFAVKLKRVIVPLADKAAALRMYVLWSLVRILIIAVPLVAGILCYHMCQSSTGLLCAAISLLASLLCIPSKSRMRSDLNIDETDKQD